MRRMILAAVVLCAACSEDSTSPDGERPWWEGTWRAVRANGQPLPARAGTVDVSALQLGFSAYQAGSNSVSETASSASCSTSTGRTTTATTVTISGWLSAVCTEAAGGSTLTFTRKGDSLSGTWRGLDVRLVKQP